MLMKAGLNNIWLATLLMYHSILFNIASCTSITLFNPVELQAHDFLAVYKKQKMLPCQDAPLWPYLCSSV